MNNPFRGVFHHIPLSKAPDPKPGTPVVANVQAHIPATVAQQADVAAGRTLVTKEPVEHNPKDEINIPGNLKRIDW